jgi:rSAM/selenodomain-associated transferase 2
LTISVIIPVLNEALRIRAMLEDLRSFFPSEDIIAVDGGSVDETPNEVAAVSGVRLLTAPRGRARQMNAGAQIASGEILLFLHADVRLPRNAAHWIERALADPRMVGGAFRTWTVSETRKLWPGPWTHLADLRPLYTGLPYGDQALFVRAKIFRAVGGVPDQPLMEDLEFSRRLRKWGRLAKVPAFVRVSARRFEARPLYYPLLMNLLPVLYRWGVPPRVLARFYGHPR